MNNNFYNVIIVDDDDLVIKSLQRVLKNESYYLWATTSPEKSLSLLSSQETAVIISDHRMPKMSGIEVLEKAKEISPSTIRIMLTGISDVELAQEAINHCGIYKLLFKPWNEPELKEAIDSAINLFKHSKEKNRLDTESEWLSKRNQEIMEMNIIFQNFVLQEKLKKQNPTRQNENQEMNVNSGTKTPFLKVKDTPQGYESQVDNQLLYLG